MNGILEYLAAQSRGKSSLCQAGCLQAEQPPRAFRIPDPFDYKHSLLSAALKALAENEEGKKGSGRGCHPVLYSTQRHRGREGPWLSCCQRKELAVRQGFFKGSELCRHNQLLDAAAAQLQHAPSGEPELRLFRESVLAYIKALHQPPFNLPTLQGWCEKARLAPNSPWPLHRALPQKGLSKSLTPGKRTAQATTTKASWLRNRYSRPHSE